MSVHSAEIIVGDSCKALDRLRYAAAVLVDLTQLLFVSGLYSLYGLTAKALVSNYLSNTKQRVKLGHHYSAWLMC